MKKKIEKFPQMTWFVPRIYSLLSLPSLFKLQLLRFFLSLSLAPMACNDTVVHSTRDQILSNQTEYWNGDREMFATTTNGTDPLSVLWTESRAMKIYYVLNEWTLTVYYCSKFHVTVADAHAATHGWAIQFGQSETEYTHSPFASYVNRDAEHTTKHGSPIVVCTRWKIRMLVRCSAHTSPFPSYL